MKRLFAFAAALTFTLMTGAQQMQPIPVDPAVRIGHLDNGLTYYIRHHEEPKGQANFYIAQKVGSILEDEEQRGLAHFLEHMCFNGTEHFPGNGVIKYCESIGVKFGADLNAYTSIDETVYNIDNVPVAKVPSSIDSCLWILHDWADGLLLAGEDIDKERGVIHEEWRSRMNSAQMRMYETILPELYPGNKYGQRLPIGLMSVVDNFPYRVLRDYYEKWYRPDQQGIIVVGDIDVAEVEAKIKDIFGTIAKPENPAERYYVQIEDNKEPIVSIAKDKEQPYAMSFIFCKHDGVPDEAKIGMDYLIYQYAIYAADLMMADRINEMLQSPEPPFIQAQVADEDFFLSKTKKALNGLVISSEDGVLKAITSVYREMLRATRGGFTASEYERARAEIISQYETAYKQRDKKKSASYCSEYVRHFIDNEPIPGEENMFALASQLAPMIPVEAINQMFGSLVGEGNLVVSCMLPDKDGITYPTADEIKAALAAVAAEDIAPYVEEVSNDPLISELPAAGKVTKTADSKFGYKKYTLSNGATVYAKKTDFNQDQIIMRAYSKGGKSLYSDAEAATLKAVNELIEIGGLGNFSATELTKKLAGKQVSLTPSVSQYTETLKGNATPKDFETLLQLNYLYFTALRADQDAFSSWKTRSAAAIANRAKQPMAAFQDTLTTSIYDNDKLVTPLTISDVENMDYARALAIAAERFSNAADFDFIITGNFDEETLVPMIEQYIASLPAGGKKEKANTKALNFTNGVISNTFDKEMEIPMVTTCFFEHGKAKYNLKSMTAYEIAMSALTNVLLEEIREKEGGTYGISADGEVANVPSKMAYYQIAYQTDPAKYEYLNNRIREIVDEFAKNGPSEENVNKAKEYLLKTYKEGLRENGYWNNVLEEWLESGVDKMSDFEKTLESIDCKAVQKTFNKSTSRKNHSEIIMHGIPAAK